MDPSESSDDDYDLDEEESWVSPFVDENVILRDAIRAALPTLKAGDVYLPDDSNSTFACTVPTHAPSISTSTISTQTSSPHRQSSPVHMTEIQAEDANGSYQKYPEPLPHIDYQIVHGLIDLARKHAGLDKHDVKRFEYIIESRDAYYTTHAKFQHAYRGLQDAYAYSTILINDRKDYEKLLEEAASSDSSTDEKMRIMEHFKKEIFDNEEKRVDNLAVMENWIEEVDMRDKTRDIAGKVFSEMKIKFLETDLDRLISIGRRIYTKETGLELPPFTTHKDSIVDQGRYAGQVVSNTTDEVPFTTDLMEIDGSPPQ